MRQQKQTVQPARTTRPKARGARNGSGGQNRPQPHAETFTAASADMGWWPMKNLPRPIPLDAPDDGDLTPDELEMERAQMARERLCVTKADAAKMLSVSVSTINKLIAQGFLPVMKIGTAARIRTKDIIEFVNGWAS